MDVGMARAAVALRGASALAAAAFAVLVMAYRAPAQPSSPEPPAVAKECGDAQMGDTPLPNSAHALQERKKIRILAIGSSSVAVLGPGYGGSPPLLERILERTIKGLDVEIVNRGFSGELAEAAGERLKIEVALNHPDIVLWQVGTNDAFAQVPVEEFQLSVGNAVRWLKSHNIDVILVGLHYMRQLAKDQHYQAIRASLRQIASTEKVLRIGRYEAMEVLERAMRATGQLDPEEFGLNEVGYNCMAQYIARTITVGLFAKPRRNNAPPAAAPQAPATPPAPAPDQPR
jgi:lysophospholipase L1-like esterase